MRFGMVENNRQSGRITEAKKNSPEFAVISSSLQKNYFEGKKQLEALKNIDLEIRRGEIVAVIGPSGAGKSTLLHILGLMEKPSSGNLNVLGWDVKDLREEEKDLLRNRYLGFLFQFHYLLPELTLLENVALPLEISGLKRIESQDRATEFLKAVGLENRKNHVPSEVSGGEQQRASLARAMVHQPLLLICDEPTGNLDLERGEEIRELIWRVARAQHSTVLVATHNPEIAKNADRTIKIVDGRISS